MKAKIKKKARKPLPKSAIRFGGGSKMKFETGLFFDSFDFAKKNVAIVLIAILSKAASPIVFQKSNSKYEILFNILLVTLCAMYAHKYVLEKFSLKRIEFNLNMGLVYAGAVAILMLLAYIFAVFGGKGYDANYPEEIQILINILAYSVFYWVSLSVLGTIFPSIVYNGDFSFRVTLARTKHVWFYIFTRLFFVAGGVIAATLFSVIVIHYLNGANEVDQPLRHLSYFSIFLRFIISITSVVITILVAIVLSRAFLLSDNFLGKSNR
jgi:hypothetical protein